MLWVNPQAPGLVSQSLSSSLSWPTEIPNCPCSARPFYSLACTFCWLTLAVLNFSCLPESFWPVAPSYVPDCALSQGHRCCLSCSLTLLDYHSAQCMGSKNISVWAGPGPSGALLGNSGSSVEFISEVVGQPTRLNSVSFKQYQNLQSLPKSWCPQPHVNSAVVKLST